MDDISRHPRGERTVSERLVLVEDGLDRLRDQREKEHKENQSILLDIRSEVRDLNKNTEGMDRRIENLEAWRTGLLSEIRGAMRVPKTLIALVPLAMVAFAVINLVHPT